MNSKNITDIVSSPTVSIFDGKKTVFEVVKNIPFKTGQTVSNDNITKTTTSIDYKDVGLKLEVLPIINKNQAFLDLSLTIENILDKSDTPVTSKRHFKQYVSLNVGETFVLNGINQTESYTDDFKTPFLSDIPYIGWLFKNEYEDIKTSNLTVLLELDY
jgi:general secretion pathway protein D